MVEGGKLSLKKIENDRRLASPGVYRQRFGSLSAAYDLVGYTQTPEQVRLCAQLAPARGKGLKPVKSPLADEEVLNRLRSLRGREGRLSLELIEITPGLPRLRNLLRRFGTVERVYELAGHTPTLRQRQRLGKPAPQREPD